MVFKFAESYGYNRPVHAGIQNRTDAQRRKLELENLQPVTFPGLDKTIGRRSLSGEGVVGQRLGVSSADVEGEALTPLLGWDHANDERGYW